MGPSKPPRPSKPRTARVFRPMTTWSQKRAMSPDRPDRYPSGRTWVPMSLKLKVSPKPLATSCLLIGLTFRCRPAALLALIGPNGAGKTTLFRMITGLEEPDAGTMKIGETVRLGYIDQNRDALKPDKTVWEEISDGLDVD